MKLYRNWIINEVARAGEHMNERTYVRTYVLTYIRTGQTLYPLHNFVVRGDYKEDFSDHQNRNIFSCKYDPALYVRGLFGDI